MYWRSYVGLWRYWIACLPHLWVLDIRGEWDLYGYRVQLCGYPPLTKVNGGIIIGECSVFPTQRLTTTHHAMKHSTWISSLITNQWTLLIGAVNREWRRLRRRRLCDKSHSREVPNQGKLHQMNKYCQPMGFKPWTLELSMRSVPPIRGHPHTMLSQNWQFLTPSLPCCLFIK